MEGEGSIHLFQQLEKIRSELQKAEDIVAAQKKDSDTLFNQVDYLTNELIEEREQRKGRERKITELEEALKKATNAQNEQDILLKETTEQLEEERAQRILLGNEKTLMERLQKNQALFEALLVNSEHAYNELLRKKCEAERRAEEHQKATLELQNQLINNMRQKMADQMQNVDERIESTPSPIPNTEEIQEPNSNKRGTGNWRNLIRIKKLRRYLKRRQDVTAKPNDTSGC